MDVALIGLLSLAGYEFSKKKKPKVVPKSDIVEEETPTFLDGSSEHGNMVHAYSGQQAPGGMSMSEGKLSRHTGTGMMEYASKSCRSDAPSTLFDPTQNLTYINGAPNVDNKDRYEVSGVMNNVLPFEQKRVGPGLNTSDCVDAKGGFHQYFRVLPANVGEYKKNNLPQRIIPGKQNIAAREELPNMDVSKNERHYEMESRPLENGKFDVMGPTQRTGPHNRTEQNRSAHENMNEVYFGAAAGGNATGSTYDNATRTKDATEYTRDGNMSMHTFKTTNVSQIITTETERGQDCNPILNVAGKGGAYTRDERLSSDPTLRSTLKNTGIGNAVGNSYATYVQNDDVLNTTHRNGTSTHYGGVAFGSERAGENRSYQANDTQREFTQNDYSGPSKYYTSHHTSGINQEQYTLKEESVIGYAPGPQNINTLVDPSAFASGMEMKNDAHAGTRINVPKVKDVITDKCMMGRVENELKIPVENSRDFFSVADVVLKDNPFAVRR